LEDLAGRRIDVSLEIDYRGAYPDVRNYAKTDGYVIYVSPKILSAEEHRIEGLLRHEFAHVVFIQSGNHHHTETETDKLAEDLFGDVILYDDDDVQSILYGRAPRPSYLPN
jgi:hypothetical protein